MESGKYETLQSDHSSDDESDAVPGESHRGKGMNPYSFEPSMDIKPPTNHVPLDRSHDFYDQSKRPQSDDESRHSSEVLHPAQSLSELPFKDLWHQAKEMVKSSWGQSTKELTRWWKETKTWLVSRYFVTWLLLYVLIGSVLFGASFLRYNALSGVYLLCLLALPLIPNPTKKTMSGTTFAYMLLVLILAAFACLTQAIFQIVLAADSPYGHNWEACNGTEPLWRQLGYQSLNDLPVGSICRLILPDVGVLIVTIIVLVACKKIFSPNNDPASPPEEVASKPPPPPPEATEGVPSIVIDSGSTVLVCSTRHRSAVAEGITSFVVMVLCAFAAVILPSALSAFYFLTFLIVITWWSFYKTWGRNFYCFCIVWMLYSGAHIIVLYLYQFQFFQNALDPEDFFARLFGLKAIVDATDCDDPREITLIGGQRWFVYVNPGAVLGFYIYLAVVVRCWIDGPETIVRKHKPPTKHHGEKKVSPQKQRLMDEATPSYQSMDPTITAPEDMGASGSGDQEAYQRQTSGGGGTAKSEEDGGHSNQKMSPLATVVAYVTKQCYIVALVVMMVWSITYHSWLTFVLLLWSIAIWILPISTTRNRAVYCSPLLVLYAECLLLIQFVYGLNLNDDELPTETKSGINLTEIGLMKFVDPCGPLAIQLLFTLTMWLTLRQYMRENRLAKMNVNSEGIILQPFGMIFSDPHEELHAIEAARVDGDFTDKGDSETMSILGSALLGVFSKYWMVVVLAMFLIVTLQDAVDIFQIIYLALFLLIINMFLWSFTLFRVIIGVFFWLVVLYCIGVLVLIYTYQFADFPGYWTNGTGISEDVLHDLGLRQYKTTELFLKLLIPTLFIIIIMFYLHYFHYQFMDITKISRSGYKPSKIQEEHDDDGAEDEADRASQSSKTAKTHSKIKLYCKYIYIILNTHYTRVACILWRLLEIHMSKIVIFSIILVVTREMTAVNGVLVLLVFLVLPLPWFTRFIFLISSLWVSVVLLLKMVFQLSLIPTDTLETNCTNNTDFPIRGTIDIATWFGFVQEDDFSAYVIGYMAILMMMILWYVALLRQEHHRNLNNLDKPRQSIIFEEVKREQADEGLVNCLKFLANYCFYKYGLEMCYITTMIVSAVRLDVLSFIYMILLLCLIFLRRKTVSYIWPLYTSILLFLLPVTYALSLGLPPMLCAVYPWTDALPAGFRIWLYLPDYISPPEGHFIVADFLQLLFVCLQLQVFRIEQKRGREYGGGDNYETTVDVENIAANPVPNFTFKKSYLDSAKSLVFEYVFWVTLAVTFLAGTVRVNLFGLIYIIFSFYFLWLGPEYLIKPTKVVVKRWNRLLGYNLLVVFVKIGLQIMTCVYYQQLLDFGLCWILQLLGLVCLQNDFKTPDVTNLDCTLPTADAGLTWDVSVFIFLVIQKRIFTSNYFQYIVLSLEEEKSLASKGAELINEVLATRVNNKRLEESRILEGIKKKMARIQKQQLELTAKTAWREPTWHDEAIRGQGGYYMFQDISEDELSDLEPDAIPALEEDEKSPKHSAFHLVHDAVAMSPESALKKDDALKPDVVDGDKPVPDEGSEVKPELPDLDKKDGPLDIEEAEDILAEIDELEAEKEGEDDKPVGVCGKIMSIVKLVWRIFLRGLEGCIHFLDGISQEYRYVAQELRKLSAEGKRQRSLKRKAKAIAPPPAAEGDVEVIEPHEPTRVSIMVEAETTRPDENVLDSVDDGTSQDVVVDSPDFKTDAVSVSGTSSSEFVRTMPRPVRFIYSLIYAIISQSQLVCYFLIILNLVLSANILSLPLPILVFTWAMLSVPRPTKRFWVTVITYTEAVVILKYFFQFYFYPWNTTEQVNLNASDPLWWPVILGIIRKDGYAVLDLCILMAAFFHRSILRRHGVWQESQVVPNLDDTNVDSQPAITSGDMSADDTDSKKRKKRRKKTPTTKTEAEVEAASQKELTDFSSHEADDEDAAADDDDETLLTASSSSVANEDAEKKSFFEPFKAFYRNMLDPTYSAVTDVYVPMFLCDVFNFIFFALFSYAFGEEQAQTDVTAMISNNSISLFFVLLLLLQFVLMVIDRAIYLRKAVVAKFIFLIIVIIGVHVWMFFLLPEINNKRFYDNTPAQIWYFVKCLYFGLSAYQIRCGYPTRILGHCLCKRYTYVNLFMYMGYQLIPFLMEIRILMDWMFTNTTLSLSHWVEVEDAYSNVYTTKCWRYNERKYPVDRGLAKSKIVKYGAGGIQLLGLIFIVWFPLLLISLSNSSSISNPPSESNIKISISGYDPLFEMTSQQYAALSQSEYNGLLDEYGKDLRAVTFLKNYRPDDIIVFTVNGDSASNWDVSPPSRKGLQEHLNSSTESVVIRYSYAFKRSTSSSLVTPNIDGFHEITLAPKDPIRKDLAEQLTKVDAAPVLITGVYPGFIRLPPKGDAEPATTVLDSEYSPGYSNITMNLENGTSKGTGGESEWWVVNKNVDNNVMSIVTISDRVASDLFAPLAGYGVIGLYLSLVLVIGKFVRMVFSGTSEKIMFNELPNVDRILKLCLDIFLIRECGEMKLEEDLTAKLIFLYRSPKTLIEFTRFKVD